MHHFLAPSEEDSGPVEHRCALKLLLFGLIGIRKSHKNSTERQDLNKGANRDLPPATCIGHTREETGAHEHFSVVPQCGQPPGHTTVAGGLEKQMGAV